MKEELKGAKGALKKMECGGIWLYAKKEITNCHRLKWIDVLEESGSLNEIDFQKRLQLQEEFWEVVKFNESLLLPKSRERWIKEGDCNSFLSLHH